MEVLSIQFDPRVIWRTNNQSASLINPVPITWKIDTSTGTRKPASIHYKFPEAKLIPLFWTTIRKVSYTCLLFNPRTIRSTLSWPHSKNKCKDISEISTDCKKLSISNKITHHWTIALVRTHRVNKLSWRLNQLTRSSKKIIKFDHTEALFRECFERKKLSIQKSVSQLQSKLISNKELFLNACEVIGQKNGILTFEDFCQLTTDEITTLFISFSWLSRKVYT